MRFAPLVGLLVLVAGLSLGPMQESDLFFRLRTGEEILRTGQIPKTNLFSFTHPDHPDLDPSWLFDVGAAALFGVAGFRGIVTAKAAVICAVFAGAWLLGRRRGAGPAASALALGAAALVMQERLVERPHIFSLAGEVATLAALAALDGARPRRAWLLVPAVMLWANLHAGAFAAPALCALHAAGALVDRRPARPAILLSGTTGIALLCSPAGSGIFRYLGFHAHIFDLHPVDEFRPVSLASDAPLLLYGAALAGVAIALVSSRRRRGGGDGDPSAARLGLRHLLPPLALAVLAARSIRFAADFALCAAPLGAVAVSDLAHRGLSGRALSVRLQGVAAALLVAVAVAPRLAAARAGRPVLDVDLDTEALPLEAIRFAEDNHLRDRMYNDFEIGSYLVWEGFPRHRVFVDPRLPAYPVEFHRLLGRTDLSRGEWDAALARYRVETALVAYAGLNRRAAWWDPARWALVYRGHDARVFVRRLPRFQPLIAAREIPATFSFTLEEGTATHPIPDPPPGSPVPRCEWDRRLGDLYFDLDGSRQDRALGAYRRALVPPACLAPAAEASTAAWLGSIALGERRAGEALPLLDRALGLAPDDLAVRTSRALALDALGRADEAGAEWSRIAGRARGTSLGARAAARAGPAR